MPNSDKKPAEVMNLETGEVAFLAAGEAESRVPVPVAPSPMDIIDRAVLAGVGSDELERLMDLNDRFEAKRARVAFTAAVAAFQARCPTVLKSKAADRYNYAPLDEVLRAIRPHLEATGLSVRFDMELTGDSVLTAICFLSHRDGHCETSRFAAPGSRCWWPGYRFF